MDDMERRLEAQAEDIERLRHVVFGNGDEGLGHAVREMQEVLYGGTPRVPKEESVLHTVREVRTGMKLIRIVGSFLGIGTIAGIAYLIALVRGLGG